MASKSLGTLTLDLVAKTAGFVQGLEKSERESAKWRKKVESNIAGVGSALGKGIAVGAGAAAASFLLIVEKSREAIDAQAKAAQRLRTTSESMATLARAGELAGTSLETIQRAATKLDADLGKAASGTGAQADALKKLKLNADEVAKLPLDQRIATINQALKQNVNESERAAVAADLFGSEAGAAIGMLTPEVIAQAAHETAVFGLNISDIDAAKIEAANDAFSTAGNIAKGFGQQLTIAVAPAIEAIGKAFFNAAEEAGGMGAVVQGGVDKAIHAVAFLIDAADGIGVAFKTAANIAIVALAGYADYAASRIGDLLHLVSYIPGVDFSEAEKSVRDFAELQGAVVNEAINDIKANLERPLAGTAFIKLFDEAKAKADAAAKAIVDARKTVDPAGATTSAQDKEKDDAEKAAAKAQAIADKKAEVEKKAAAKAEEDRKKALADQLESVRQAMRTEEEVIEETYQRRREIVLQSVAETGTAQTELLAKLETDRNEQLAKLDAARTIQQLQNYETLFGNAAALTKQFMGEQSTAYKVMFALEKAAGIARSIVAIQTGIANAFSLPYPENLAAAGTVIASTANIVSTIQGTEIAGSAHDGMMSIPETGSYYLKKGERVTTEKTSAKLDKTLNQVQQQQDGSSGNDGNLQINNMIDPAFVGDYMSTAAGDRVFDNYIDRNQTRLKRIVGGGR